MNKVYLIEGSRLLTCSLIKAEGALRHGKRVIEIDTTPGAVSAQEIKLPYQES